MALLHSGWPFWTSLFFYFTQFVNLLKSMPTKVVLFISKVFCKIWQVVGVFQAGLIRVSKEEYLITPLPQHLANQHNYSAPDGHHPHVVYKRSAEHIVHGRSVSPASTGPSSSENPYLSDHHHHQPQSHHDYQHGKLQWQHFCGRRKQCM